MAIYVVGAGVGTLSILTLEAQKAIKDSDVVLATKRLSKSFSELNNNFVECDISKLCDFADKYDKEGMFVSILVSGDACFYSFAQIAKLKLGDRINKFINGVNSLQYLCSKLQISYDDILSISMHGRDVSIIPYVSYNRKVFALTDSINSPSKIICNLLEVGLSHVEVTVGENLSYINERIVTGKPEYLNDYEYEPLSVVLINNPDFINSYERTYDSSFIRDKIPMTKQDIRYLATGYLNIKPTDKVIDIGAGTGSVSIEIARKAYKSLVYAVEEKIKAVELLKANIKKLKAFNIIPIHSKAPEGLIDMPVLDKAFIGGSSGLLKEILEFLYSNNPAIEIVLTAVTLETLNLASQLFEKKGVQIDIVCVNISRSKKTGSYNMMLAENPVYIITTSSKKGSISL